jgi:hypothetical protein
MNLVKQIMDQLSGGALGQLSSLLGTDAAVTERAATAAVPSLLSALAGMASNDDGVRKLTNALSGLDASSLGNFAQALGGNTSSLLGNGTSLLGSLFGDSMVSGLVSVLSRITGLNAGLVKTLLAYLMPLVLGKVAAQWKNQGGTSQALKSLFADQRKYIESAVPAGFSLADIPDAGDVKTPAYSTTRRVEDKPVAAGSPARWILPLALALLGGYFLWQFLSRPRADQPVTERTVNTVDDGTAMRPVLPAGVDVPNLTSVRDDLGGLFTSLDTAFSDIRDAASAERAMPALRDLNTRIDSIDQMLSRLPEAGRATLRPELEQPIKATTDKANAASSIEGISAEIKALIREIVAKITKWISAR